MNPLSETQFHRLHESIRWSNRQLVFQKDKRVEALKMTAGYHYASTGEQKKQPVNFLALALLIYVRQLVPRAPRALITTKRRDLKPTAANFELAVNQIPAEIKLDDTLRRFVMEAMFAMGVVKVGLHTVGTALGHNYGKSFVDIVTFDDYFCDMSARHYSQIDYEGNDYWLDYEEVMDSDWVDKKMRSDLKPDMYQVVGPMGEQRGESMTTTEMATQYRDKLWLRDVWLPREQLLVTYGVKSEKILCINDWKEPAEGPYHKLGFADLPSNFLPLAPVSLWRDLHELANSLFRKLGNQADGQKRVLGFPGGNDESVENFKNAKDGDGIQYSGAEPRALDAGGVNPTTLAFFLQTKQLINYFWGNLDSLGGLAPQTQTLGQDRLLDAAAGAQLHDMATKTVDSIRGIFQALAYYEWNDPIQRRTLEKQIPGAGTSIVVPFGNQQKTGDFDLYDLQIDVYSLQDDTPNTKLQKLGQIVQQYILPLQPFIQQSGGEIDVQALFQMVARYADFPEISEIVIFVDQSGQSQGNSTGHASIMPSQTTHTSERVGRPGMTSRGADAAMMQTLMGGNPGGEHVPQGTA